MDCIDFALACYRQPLAYQDRLSLAAPLPEGMDRLLWLANGSPEAVETAVLLTGARPQELQDAARFCIQQLCFVRGANPHRVLGLEPGAAPERIKEHHRLLMRLFHPDRAAGKETWTEGYAARVNEAWTTLSRTPSPFDAQSSSAPPELGGSSAGSHRFPTPPGFPPPARRRVRIPSQWVPGLVLSGLALVATLVLGSWYLDQSMLRRPESLPPAIGAGPPDGDAASSKPAANPSSGTVAFLDGPDWQRLEQREQQARQQADRVQENRQQLEQNRREQLTAEEAALERVRVERVRLEEQLKAEQARMQQAKAERLAVERQRLDQLKAEQLRLEQSQSERIAAERRRLEELQIEQAKAERLAEELRTERRRLEQAKAEQARIDRAKADLARVESVRPDHQQEADRARAERLRLETQLQTERAKADQAKAERLRLEAQLQAEQAKAEQVRLNVVTPDDRDLTVQDLDELMGRYTRAYERGDLGGIMALFAANTRNERSRVRQDYTALLATHQVRQLWLQGLNWTYQGETASGSGRYHLQLQQRDNGDPTQVQGNIRFKVRKHGRQALIESIDYDWQAN